MTSTRRPRSVFIAALALLAAAAAALPGRADDGPSPPADPEAPADARAPADEEPPAPARAPDLVAPPPELAAHLSRFDEEAEPGRELKRAFVSVVAYLLAADVERALPYFHPDLRFHVGAGDLEPVAPAQLARVLGQQREEAGASGEARSPLADVLDLASVRAYSRARAAEVDAAAEGWKEVEPAQVARLMQEGDWLVLARLRGGEWGGETFYVFRKDGARYKVVLAE